MWHCVSATITHSTLFVGCSPTSWCAIPVPICAAAVSARPLPQPTLLAAPQCSVVGIWHTQGLMHCTTKQLCCAATPLVHKTLCAYPLHACPLLLVPAPGHHVPAASSSWCACSCSWPALGLPQQLHPQQTLGRAAGAAAPPAGAACLHCAAQPGVCCAV